MLVPTEEGSSNPGAYLQGKFLLNLNLIDLARCGQKNSIAP